MIFLQASQLGSFLLMVFMGAVLVVGLPVLAALFRKLFNRAIPRERLEEKPFYYQTLSKVASVGLAAGIVISFLALVFFLFG